MSAKSFHPIVTVCLLIAGISLALNILTAIPLVLVGMAAIWVACLIWNVIRELTWGD